MADAGTWDDDAGAKKRTTIQTAIAVVILTLVAGAGGAFVGWLNSGSAASAPAEAVVQPPAETASPPSDIAAAEGSALPLRLIALKPVVTNIYAPANAWLRIEASIVVEDDGSIDAEVLAAEIEADTLAFLRSLQLAQVEGTRGLLHLRDDLRERAKLRSPAVVDYLIQAMVAE
ncbi:flagellar basal body-associated FliL family protein [Aurantimonas sp. HBX-1]|uniref:flagellar basal body-associated FliL family protein n=1 Tax=Aurantimonas sp. HBX-1 TaxID=2906072 RepID=UPI001F2DEF28|nr:flagellar basal body-associated FliL family protein [Aurantimonas sp. HBX-1]UIJ72871.1 flagellar basal body-associated FliL family protein [Aurantimonas sp. HBX-1]